MQIEGYAAVFNVPSEPLLEFWGIEEIFLPGAFAKTIQEADVRALFNHDADLVFARTKPPAGYAPTLALSEDVKGLLFAATGDTRISYVSDLSISIARGDVSQASLAFIPIQQRWTDRGEDEPLLREIIEARLYDVSPVTYPAFEQTSIWLTPRDIEQIAELDTKGSAQARRIISLLDHGMGDTNEPRASEHSNEPEPQAGHHSDEPPIVSHSDEPEANNTEGRSKIAIARRRIAHEQRLAGGRI